MVKSRYVAAIAVIALLAVLIPGVAAAVAPDAKVQDVYWNTGSEMFPESGSYQRGGYNISFSVPGYSYLRVWAPLTVPSSLNARNCSVRKTYLYWNASSNIMLHDIEVYSGNSLVKTVYPLCYGTGSDQLITVDLTAGYPVPRGLSAGYNFRNDFFIPQPVVINGYGAMIVHKA